MMFFWNLLLCLCVLLGSQSAPGLLAQEDPTLNITSITGWEGPVGEIGSVKRVTTLSLFNRRTDRLVDVQTTHFGLEGDLRNLSVAIRDGSVWVSRWEILTVLKESFFTAEYFEDRPLTIGRVELQAPAGVVDVQVTYQARRLIQGGEEVIETFSVPDGALPSGSIRFQAQVWAGSDTGFKLLNPNTERVAVQLELFSLYQKGAVNYGYGLDPIATELVTLGPGEIYSRSSLAEVFTPTPISLQGGITLPPGSLLVTDGSVRVTASHPIYGTASRVDLSAGRTVVSAVPVYSEDNK